MRNPRVAAQQDFQNSRRDRPDRDDRRSNAGNNNFGARSGDGARDRDRRVPSRDDFTRRGDRFSDKSKSIPFSIHDPHE